MADSCTISPAQAGQGTGSGVSGRKTRVYITVDTETSMGGSWRNPAFRPVPLDRTVFGQCGERMCGIPLMMDILEEHGFRATFFTEVFCAYIVGHEEVARVFQTIRERGHDAQLHLHPVYVFYRDFLAGRPRREADLMFRLPLDEQRELIAQGVSLFRELSGQTPRAYRAGCYGASEATLQALYENGIEIDSSYNLAYRGITAGFDTPDLNAPVKLGDVYEFPVTVFRVRGTRGYKPLEISAVSVPEILTTLRAMQAAGCEDVVLVLHSFSTVKKRGVQFEDCRPDRIVIRRLRNLCAALAALRDEVEIAVLGEADLPSISVPQPQVIPALGWMAPSIRKMCQAINRLPWV